MRRSSPYHGLKWVVEVKWPGNAFYEVISAYNSESVAKAYADKCMSGASPINGKPWAYRVRERDGRGKWTVIYKAGDNRWCHRDGCDNPLPPDQLVYCSNECAYMDT